MGRDRYASTVSARTHRLVADEPTAVGGTDQGPTPYEYLAAALGSCTAITLRMYADRKAWPLEAIDVDVSHEKVHAKDCDCETTATGRIDLISRVITLHGDLDQVQRARLMEIADRCPVHRTLTGDIVVKTRELRAA
jgi:putative redox protein